MNEYAEDTDKLHITHFWPLIPRFVTGGARTSLSPDRLELEVDFDPSPLPLPLPTILSAATLAVSPGSPDDTPELL